MSCRERGKRLWNDILEANTQREESLLASIHACGENGYQVLHDLTSKVGRVARLARVGRERAMGTVPRREGNSRNLSNQ